MADVNDLPTILIREGDLPTCSGGLARAARPRLERDPDFPLLPPWRCVVCRLRFDRHDLRARHFEEHGERPFACPVAQCSAASLASFTEAELQQHVAVQHAGLKPFVCETCGRGTESVRALQQHSLRHSQPLRCPDAACGGSLDSLAEYDDHVDAHMDLVPMMRLRELSLGMLSLARAARAARPPRAPRTRAPATPTAAVKPAQPGVGETVRPGQAGPHGVKLVKPQEQAVRLGQAGPHGVKPQEQADRLGQAGPHGVKPVKPQEQAVRLGQAGPHGVELVKPQEQAVRPGQAEPHGVKPQEQAVRPQEQTRPERTEHGVEPLKSEGIGLSGQAHQSVQLIKSEETEASPRQADAETAVANRAHPNPMLVEPTTRAGEFRILGIVNAEAAEARPESSKPIRDYSRNRSKPAILSSQIRQAYYKGVGPGTLALALKQISAQQKLIKKPY